MGLSSSKRVSGKLRDSLEFNSACDSVYSECLALTQHAFPGVRPYQLSSASDRLHHNLSALHFPLVDKWVPTPPTRSQVDKAFQAITRRLSLNLNLNHPPPVHDEGNTVADDDNTLGPSEFKEFAVDLYTDAVVSNAGKAVLQRVPIGVAGIAGIGAATRSGKELVGTAIGVYAIGVATAIYVSLAG